MDFTEGLLADFPDLIDLQINNMPTLSQVCVWTTPFPTPDLNVDLTGSPNVYFTTDCTTGIEEIIRPEVTIYPNPANKLLTIETDCPGPCSITITSLNGQEVNKGEMEGSFHEMDLSSFQKGVYFITIRSKDFLTTRKLIKL